MTKTNEQVEKAIKRITRNNSGEALYTALLNYWVKYDLSQEQCEMLNRAKKEA
jgi:hypothetical protein